MQALGFGRTASSGNQARTKILPLATNVYAVLAAVKAEYLWRYRVRKHEYKASGGSHPLIFVLIEAGGTRPT